MDNNENKYLDLRNVSFEKTIKGLENYFKRNAETNELFKPEFEAAKKINDTVLKEDVTEKGIKAIVQIFNDTNLKPHYDGCGWRDLKFQIESFLRKEKIDYKTSFGSGNIEMFISKKPVKQLKGIIWDNEINKSTLSKEIGKINWKVEKNQLGEFEIFYRATEVSVIEDIDILLSGFIHEDQFDKLVKVLNDMKIDFRLELFDESKNIEKTATNK